MTSLRRAQGEGIRTGSLVLQGGTMKVEVGPNHDHVTVSAGVAGETFDYDVPPDKIATIPVPPVPPGTVLKVTVGRGARRRVIYVEVVSQSP
ncbi:MAG TPA: hypothetical protein ENI87_07675 [bacterium]|nr:hypothetical protein [bacterium]